MNVAANRPHLLVVDDEAGMRTLIKRIGRQAGFEVTESGDAESLREALRCSYEVIALDLSMPDVDGIEVIRELAKIKCQSRIVLVSGFDRRVMDTAARLAKSLGLRLHGSLSKPFDVADMLALFSGDREVAGASDNRVEVTREEFRAALDNAELRRPMSSPCRSQRRFWSWH